jgi:hypothetical protein
VAIDDGAIVYSAVITCCNVGVEAYNMAIEQNLLDGVRPAMMKPFDEQANGRLESKLLKKRASQYPQVDVEYSGGFRNRATAKTFAFGPAADAIFQRMINLQIVIAHEEMKLSGQTPIEAFLDAAINADPKLGILNCKGFEMRESRKIEEYGGKMRAVTRWAMSVELVRHQLQPA